MGLEKSGVPGTFVVWPDILYEGPTPLAAGDEWIRVRARYLADGGYGHEEEILREYREHDAALESYAAHDEVVFWLEHDLFDQLLLIRHLWWVGARGAWGARGAQRAAEGGTRFSLVCTEAYLGRLTPERFPSLFERRQPIAEAQVRAGAEAWTAFCSSDPSGLVPLASTPSADLPFLPGALRRHLEEFPSADNGLARSEAHILRILAERPTSPEQTFAALSRTEERVFMGDASFWTIVRRLAAGPHPLVIFDVKEHPGRLPSGTIRLAAAARDVLSGAADHVTLNGIDRWLGGAHLTPERLWRWTGSSLLPAAV